MICKTAFPQFKKMRRKKHVQRNFLFILLFYRPFIFHVLLSVALCTFKFQLLNKSCKRLLKNIFRTEPTSLLQVSKSKKHNISSRQVNQPIFGFKTKVGESVQLGSNCLRSCSPKNKSHLINDIFQSNSWQILDQMMYRTHAIITRNLYTFHPLFEFQKRFFKGLFSQNSGLMYGQYSRAVSNQERVIVARVWYYLEF